MPLLTPSDLAHAFDTHAASLVLYARHWVDRAAAEDTVQEVFLRLAALDPPPDNLRAWLLTCVRNAATDALRGTQRRTARDRAAGQERLFLRTSRAPADGLDAEEVQAALQRLAPTEHEIILLRIWNGATFEEIAALLQMPLSSVYAKYQSGLAHMRARWEEPCPKH